MTIPATPQDMPSVVLPEPRLSTSNFLRNILHEGVLHVSGQLPYEQGQITIVGTVGRDVSLESAKEAARLCALNALATVAAELGSLDRVAQVLRMTGYVASTPEFGEHPAVIDAASAVLVEVLGDRGRHARSAIGVSSLPRRAAVEIEIDVSVVNQGNRDA
jgi:enamine deaminase RidA (YjgF/YER057c/UK114 family)